MAVARMAAHNPGVLAGAAAAAAGRLPAIAASEDPSASWPARLPCRASPVPSSACIPDARPNIGSRSDAARTDGPAVTARAWPVLP